MNNLEPTSIVRTRPSLKILGLNSPGLKSPDPNSPGPDSPGVDHSLKLAMSEDV